METLRIIGIIVGYIGLNNYQHNFEVHLRYPRLYLYETIILVISLAPILDLLRSHPVDMEPQMGSLGLPFT